LNSELKKIIVLKLFSFMKKGWNGTN